MSSIFLWCRCVIFPLSLPFPSQPLAPSLPIPCHPQFMVHSAAQQSRRMCKVRTYHHKGYYHQGLIQFIEWPVIYKPVQCDFMLFSVSHRVSLSSVFFLCNYDCLLDVFCLVGWAFNDSGHLRIIVSSWSEIKSILSPFFLSFYPLWNISRISSELKLIFCWFYLPVYCAVVFLWLQNLSKIYRSHLFACLADSDLRII